jgi:hypothetical protein
MKMDVASTIPAIAKRYQSYNYSKLKNQVSDILPTVFNI